ncbi:metal-sulfur cluster biosynthetic enzyme [Halarchaeum solikamskense]|uniref:metal-sulfur cluster assembly factor n=1 Tax=Halarchaeum nitratireducens TaxID=489913 RepID=UPI001FDA0D38|nr:metal-sulfur cluster assembly factor [Halarchaeum solikamskense]MBP2251692.1 metal-sulfur cluster biosynthetic enzyme [Halarchaeum solikamskense]
MSASTDPTDATDPIEERARDALRDVVDPCSAATGSNLNIVEMGLVKAIEVDSDDGRAHVEMRLTTPMCHMIGYFIDQVEDRLTGLEPVERVELDTDDGMEWSEELMSEAARAKRRDVLDGYEERYREELGDDGSTDRPADVETGG